MTTIKLTLAAILSAGVIAASTALPALAWRPHGVIVKKVQDITTQSALVDANTANDALAVNKGDTLKYVITITNDGEPNSDGHNDMAFTKLTDTLPAGIELVSDPTARTITADLGTLKPGQSITKEYSVKVISSTNGAMITNKACFTGDSAIKDYPQSGCNDAVVKVKVPETPTPPTPPQVLSEKTPDNLPSTGSEQMLGTVVGLGAAAYGVSAYLRSKQNLTASHKR